MEDFAIETSDLTINSPEGVLVTVILFNDSLAGEPVEDFTYTGLPPASPNPLDAMFLFRDSVFNIVDINSENGF